MSSQTVTGMTSVTVTNSSAWPMYGGNPQHTGLSPYDSNVSGTGVQWRHRFSGEIGFCSCPIIGPENTIYMSAIDGKLYAIDPNGSEIWTYTLDCSSDYPAVIDGSGTVYVGAGPFYKGMDEVFHPAFLYAISHDGSLKWKTTLNGTPAGMVLSNDGRVIYCCENNFSDEGWGCNLRALNLDGSLQWTVHLPHVYSVPTIGKNASILLHTNDYYHQRTDLYCYYPDGTLKWYVQIGNPGPSGYQEISSPTIGSDGIIYVGTSAGDQYGVASQNGRFCAVNQNGSILWNFTTAGEIDCTPAIGPDGTIYFLSEEWRGWLTEEDFLNGTEITIPGRLHALNPNGTLKWEKDIGSYHGGAILAIGAEGIIYFGAGNYFYAFNPNGQLGWSYKVAGFGSGAVIGADGTQYFMESYYLDKLTFLYAVKGVPIRERPPDFLLTGVNLIEFIVIHYQGVVFASILLSIMVVGVTFSIKGQSPNRRSRGDHH
jgi:outer membrane protein assembly factor BamB